MLVSQSACRLFGGTVLSLGLLLLGAAFLPMQAQADHPPVPAKMNRELTVGDSEVYEFDGITAAAVGSPAVADIVPLSGHRLLVNACGPGQTTLFVYDRRGRHRLRLTVAAPRPDLRLLAARIQAEIGLPGVTARAIQDTVFLEGSVPGPVALQRASAIAGVYTPHVKNLLSLLPAAPNGSATLAQTYAALLSASFPGTGVTVQVIDDKTIALRGEYTPAPEEAGTAGVGKAEAGKAEVGKAEGGPEMDLSDSAPRRTSSRLAGSPLSRLIGSLPPGLTVIDLLNLHRPATRQILVKAKIIDIDRTASKSLGVRWGTLDSVTGRSGSTYQFQPQPILFGQYPAGGGAFNSSLLGGGKLDRILPFAAQLNLLISENKARILSEPSLMVLDGSDGSILVGGEIPVPVAQGSSGTSGISASVTIQYKPYGVRLRVSASLVGENRVQMTVTPEVSELNYTNAVQISGFTIPALTVRRATSTLQMGDGETLVIGGLYSSTASRVVERIPLLSQIPVLGEFFKNTTTRKEENELLILLQPQIVTADTPGTRPPPAGSPENLPVGKPAVGREDFDKDFPDLQKREPVTP